MPLCATASSAATPEKSAADPMVRRTLRLMRLASAGSTEAGAPAMTLPKFSFHSVMARMPERFAFSASYSADDELPSGLTTPIPVTTALRFSIIPRRMHSPPRRDMRTN